MDAEKTTTRIRQSLPMTALLPVIFRGETTVDSDVDRKSTLIPRAYFQEDSELVVLADTLAKPRLAVTHIRPISEDCSLRALDQQTVESAPLKKSRPSYMGRGSPHSLSFLPPWTAPQARRQDPRRTVRRERCMRTRRSLRGMRLAWNYKRL